MRVTHNDDYDTHAVIGGQNVQEFGIAQTAEFFTVLSNTLYSNKPLAVVREVLCNAWDAHIAAGRTDKSVIVKTSDKMLSIRDFGNGIPHELIHDIYCVYGSTTKENDGNQTGGFGLGSKSPFAYSDHFTVVNHYNGLKQVHAISRGSTVTCGKPDRRVMVSVPTTETGVEVIIPIKNPGDAYLFSNIAINIAAFGEMNVVVDGNLVDILPISTAKDNIFLTNRHTNDFFNRINIRYGNVVYPVHKNIEYANLWTNLSEIIISIPGPNKGKAKGFGIILQAPPNSISVTPSRESISNTETTINTIKKLFTDVINRIQPESEVFIQSMLDAQAKAIDYLCDNSLEDDVWTSENLLTHPKIPKPTKNGLSPYNDITSIDELADFYLRNKGTLSVYINRRLSIQRAEMMLTRGARHPHFVKHYIRITKEPYKGYMNYSESFKKRITRPLVRRIAKHEVLDHNKLYICQQSRHPDYGHRRHLWVNYHKFLPDYPHFLKLLQGVVVITHSKQAYQEDWNALVVEKRIASESSVRMVYVAPRSKGHKEEAVKFFTDLGYKVIDFAAIYDEAKAKENVLKKKDDSIQDQSKVKNEGLVLLSNYVDKDNYFYFNTRLHETAPRSQDYEFVMKPHSFAQGKKQIFPWGDYMAKDVILLFGSKIGICVSKPQLLSQKREGKEDAILHIAKVVAEKMLTSTVIRNYAENLIGPRNLHNQIKILLEIASYSDFLKKNFGVPDDAEVDLTYYRIYESMTHSINWIDVKELQDGTWEKIIYDVKCQVAKWSTTPTKNTLAKRVYDCKTLNYLCLQNMVYDLRTMEKTDPDYSRKKVLIESTIFNTLNLGK